MGRGAWPNDGAGYTKNVKGDLPGPYYVFVNRPREQVGMHGGWGSTDVDVRAVHGAVIAIQRALNRRLTNKVRVTGRFDQPTRDAVAEFQRTRMTGQTDWGGVGPDTAKAMFWPDVVRRSKSAAFGYPTIVCGIIAQESMFDPGAVGKVDEHDLGLAQINGPSHPEMSEQTRLQPIPAIDFVVSYLTNAMSTFDNNLDDSIASYNLGIGGARSWIRDGRPDVWTPPGSSTPRAVRHYITTIKQNCAGKP